MRITSTFLSYLIAGATCFFLTTPASAQSTDTLPQWIWPTPTAAPNEIVYLRTNVTLTNTPRTAVINALADGAITVYINGQEALTATGRSEPTARELSRFFKRGENTIAIRAENDDVAGSAIALKFDIVLGGFIQRFKQTDSTWRAATQETPGWQTPTFDDSAWKTAHSFGALTDNTHTFGDGGMGNAATALSDIDVPDNFEIELVRSSRASEGSWISIAFDKQNRITLGVEREGALRLTLNNNGDVTHVENLTNFPGEARGLLYAHNSLYANISDYKNNQNGVYRLQDTNGDNQYDAAKLIVPIGGGAGHGRNSLRLGPDNLIYVICGDSTKFPSNTSPNSPYQFTGDGMLPDRPHNAPGAKIQHAAIGPGGYLARFDPDGKNVELLASGLRNPYDIDFNADGELFTFDADMEPDAGAPWYRPTRVYHLTAGGEFGWRKGVGQWPVYFPDMAPTVVDIGLSSPTGIVFGTRANFPQKFRDALYLADWSYGKIIAVHTKEKGSTYTATFEDFALGRPFNVTDVEIGPDGAMYITTGGRGTQSGLYRVTYTGPKELPSDRLIQNQTHAQRDLRHRIEAKITAPNSYAPISPKDFMDAVRGDALSRNAARLIAEHQMTPQNTLPMISAARIDNLNLTLLPVIRTATDTPTHRRVIDVLNHMQVSSAAASNELIAYARVYQLALIALATNNTAPLPDEVRQPAIDKIDTLFPSFDASVNREFSRLLVYLNAPSVVEKSLALQANSTDPEEQAHYAWLLRHVQVGWNPALRRQYFQWFNHATSFTGGAALHQHLQQIKTDAEKHLTQTQRDALQNILNQNNDDTPFGPPDPNRPFVERWTVGHIAPLLNRKVTRSNADNGRAVFINAGCAACHRVETLGRGFGPDLTQVGARFAKRDLLTHILEPSAAIDVKFKQNVITTTDNQTHVGQIASEEADSVTLTTNPWTGDQLTLRRDQIATRQELPVSPMPAGLLDTFNQQHIMDLLEYLAANRAP